VHLVELLTWLSGHAKRSFGAGASPSCYSASGSFIKRPLSAVEIPSSKMKKTLSMISLFFALAIYTKAESYAQIDDLNLRIYAPEGFIEASHYLPHTKVDTPANRFVGYFLKTEDLKHILSGGRMIKDVFIKIDLLKASITTKTKAKDIDEVAAVLAKQYGRVFDRKSPDVRLGLGAALDGFRQEHGPNSSFTIKAITFLGQFFKDEGMVSFLMLQPTKYNIGSGEFDAVLVSSLSVVSVEGHVILVSIGRVYSASDHISSIEKTTVSFLLNLRKAYGAW